MKECGLPTADVRENPDKLLDAILDRKKIIKLKFFMEK